MPTVDIPARAPWVVHPLGEAHGQDLGVGFSELARAVLGADSAGTGNKSYCDQEWEEAYRRHGCLFRERGSGSLADPHLLIAITLAPGPH
jgi:hypothetical protein